MFILLRSLLCTAENALQLLAIAWPLILLLSDVIETHSIVALFCGHKTSSDLRMPNSSRFSRHIHKKQKHY